MDILIVSATILEIAPLLDRLPGAEDRLKGGQSPFRTRFGRYRVDVLIPGIGMMKTAFHLGRVMASETYDLVVQAGIAGAFDRTFSLCDLVEVTSQRYGDMGVENEIGLWDIFDLQLEDPAAFPFEDGVIRNPGGDVPEWPALPKVSGVSVNEISSHEAGIGRIRSKYDPQTESMEGIAFHYACRLAGQPYKEVRAISNYVEERNRDAWDIPGAVTALNDYLIEVLSDGGTRGTPLQS